MRILHIGKYYPPAAGGMECFLQDLAESQACRGQSVYVFCHQHTQAVARAAAPPEYLVNERSLPVIHRQRTIGPILHTPVMLRPRTALRRVLASFTPDVIHVHWPNPVVLWLLPLLERLDVPVVIQWHSDTITGGVSPWLKGAHAVLRPQERRLLDRASAVVCSSSAYANFSPLLQPYKNKLRVIPLGLNFTRLQASNPDGSLVRWADALWPAGAVRLLSLGRLSFYKNLPALIRLVAQARDRKDLPVHLVIAGDGPQAQSLVHLVNQLQLADRVRLLGAVDDRQAQALYAQSGVFALASNDRAESFGLVLLEALFHGKPLLVANTPGSGMSSVVEATQGGVLFDPDSSSDALDKLAQAGRLAVAPGFSQRVKRTVQERFSIHAIGDQWQRLYREVRAAAHAGRALRT